MCQDNVCGLIYVYFRAGRYEVDGYVYSAAEEPKMMVTGKWNKSLSYQPCDQEGDPLPGTELKEVWLSFSFQQPEDVFFLYSGNTTVSYFADIWCWSNLLFPQVWKVAPTPANDKHQYTYFAHKLNSFDTAPKKLLPSDSRLRPDRYALEKGDMSKSGAEKSR
jgi:hypothetical protein